jgi:hypothetical protein
MRQASKEGYERRNINLSSGLAGGLFGRNDEEWLNLDGYPRAVNVLVDSAACPGFTIINSWAGYSYVLFASCTYSQKPAQ